MVGAVVVATAAVVAGLVDVLAGAVVIDGAIVVVVADASVVTEPPQRGLAVAAARDEGNHRDAAGEQRDDGGANRRGVSAAWVRDPRRSV